MTKAMTVKQLIKKLSKYPENAEILIPHDEIEGLIKLTKISNYEKRMKELEMEYNEFLKTKSGQEWKEHYNNKTGYDFGKYLYDFYPEMLM